MEQSESLAKLAGALVKAQAEFPAVHKDATNPHFKSRFASLDAIMSAVVPVLNANGIAVVQGGGAGSDDAALEVVTRLQHSSGEWLQSRFRLPLAKADPQGAGSAMTYGKRYGLAAMVGVVADEDDDAEAATPRASEAPAPRPASKPKASPAPTAAGGAIPKACPKCGGGVWDNRENKTNPKAPDWKCKDKTCVDERGFVTGGWAEKPPLGTKSTSGGPGDPNNFGDIPPALEDTSDDLPW